MNTFSIERGDNVIHGLVFAKDGCGVHPVCDMSFDDLSNSEDLSDIIDAMLDATDEAFGPGIEDIFITLVDEDGHFVWSINIEQDDSSFSYRLIDWCQKGHLFCYAEDGDCT